MEQQLACASGHSAEVRTMFNLPIRDPMFHVPVETSQDVIISNTSQYNISGYANLGNTCYMNSVLQGLFANTWFIKDLTICCEQVTSIDQSLTSHIQLSCIISKLANTHDKSMEEHRLVLLQLIRGMLNFVNHAEQDAHEFLIAVLCAIKEEWDNLLNVVAAEMSDNERFSNNPICRNYGFVIECTFKCKRCGLTSVCRESNFFITTSFSQNISDEQESVTLQELFDKYLCSESVEKKCEKCSHSLAEKHQKFTRIPKCFIVCNKRYAFSTAGARKVKIAVDVHNNYIRLEQKFIHPEAWSISLENEENMWYQEIRNKLLPTYEFSSNLLNQETEEKSQQQHDSHLPLAVSVSSFDNLGPVPAELFLEESNEIFVRRAPAMTDALKFEIDNKVVVESVNHKDKSATEINPNYIYTQFGEIYESFEDQFAEPIAMEFSDCDEGQEFQTSQGIGNSAAANCEKSENRSDPVNEIEIIIYDESLFVPDAYGINIEEYCRSLRANRSSDETEFVCYLKNHEEVPYRPLSCSARQSFCINAGIKYVEDWMTSINNSTCRRKSYDLISSHKGGLFAALSYYISGSSDSSAVFEKAVEAVKTDFCSQLEMLPKTDIEPLRYCKYLLAAKRITDLEQFLIATVLEVNIWIYYRRKWKCFEPITELQKCGDNYLPNMKIFAQKDEAIYLVRRSSSYAPFHPTEDEIVSKVRLLYSDSQTDVIGVCQNSGNLNSASNIYVCENDGDSKIVSSARSLLREVEDKTANPSSQTDTSSPSFVLISFLTHIGDRTDGGHYVCDVRSQLREKWLKCNDNEISVVHNQTSFNDRLANAYIYFFLNE
ncbi:unnamed protein product [Thelazia callipaeda]|uniref:Ubiquitin carboxyl-terminal hydrolase n=1 Tax=Thelazia callipaeda TaxID=103827 RepID=A0A0N5D2V7_THECL|nr:unnamed protein product [Thelazia callipaeda]